MKASAILILSLFLSCIGCHNYPDDPWYDIHLRPPASRVVGVWEIERLLIDGNDSTSELTANPSLACKYRFTKEKFSGGFKILYVEDCSSGFVHPALLWKLNSEDITWDRYCYLTFYYQFGAPLPGHIGPVGDFRGIGIDWKIYALTKSKLWLNVDYFGKNYELRFRKL